MLHPLRDRNEGMFIQGVEGDEGIHQVTTACPAPVLHRPQKNEKSRFSGQIHDWKNLYLRVFLRTMFHNSAITPASPRIRKSTTLRSNLLCSHYSVAKLQQFSCPLGTAALSRTLENVGPGRWICSCSYSGQVFFYCSSIDEQPYSYVRVFFEKSLYDITLCSSSKTLKHSSVFFSFFF